MVANVSLHTPTNCKEKITLISLLCYFRGYKTVVSSIGIGACLSMSTGKISMVLNLS